MVDKVFENNSLRNNSLDIRESIEDYNLEVYKGL